MNFPLLFLFAVYTFQQVRLAGWLALSSDEILSGMHHLTMVQARQYHVAQKRRLNWWLAQSEEADDQAQFEILRSVTISEVLTRVWTGIVAGWYQTNHGDTGCHHETFRIFAAVQSDHLKMKEQLAAITSKPTYQYKLRELSRRCQRWTDLLLGYMNEIPGTEAYGYRRDRIEEYASEVRWQQASGQATAARTFTNLSLKQVFGRPIEPQLIRNDTQRELNGICSTAILSCLDKFRVDIPESWIQYCAHPANQGIALAQRLIDQWRRVDRGELQLLN